MLPKQQQPTWLLLLVDEDSDVCSVSCFAVPELAGASTAAHNCMLAVASSGMLRTISCALLVQGFAVLLDRNLLLGILVAGDQCSTKSGTSLSTAVMSVYAFCACHRYLFRSLTQAMHAPDICFSLAAVTCAQTNLHLSAHVTAQTNEDELQKHRQVCFDQGPGRPYACRLGMSQMQRRHSARGWH